MNQQTNLPVIPEKFIFQDQEIDFEITGTNVMVNATQMAKIFGKKVNHFMENENTLSFIKTCLNVAKKSRNSGFISDQNKDNYPFSEDGKSENSEFLNEVKTAELRFLDIENEDDLIISTQKSGTWMHRILALKFAAWLDPEFELWVYTVIDELLFGHYRELEKILRKSAETRNKIDELREQLRDDPRFAELENLELQDKQYARIRSRKTNDQLSLFRNLPNS